MKTKQRIRTLATASLGVMLLFSSCQNEKIEDNITDDPTINGKFIEKYFRGDLVEVEEIGNGEYLYNSDIILSEEMLSDKAEKYDPEKAPVVGMNEKLALYGSVRKWPNNTVIYRLGNLNNTLRSNLREAFKRWSSKTNIRFKERTNESYYVTIYQSNNVCSGCGRASFGVQGTRGTIQLGHSASISLIVHEIGHTLGFVHEQTRADRDNYVRIRWENIQPGMEGNFRKSNNARLLTDQFDINSIMMYHPYGFSKNRQPTITLLNGQIYHGAQSTISRLDIAGTNSAYPINNPGDICKGISEWVRGRQYFVGDQVTYRGYLYTLLSNYNWKQEGRCGN
ncbi:M12 family metallopeptidase [Aquimarina hainanensis]|uniref:M12 family metallopeptidase n=1 Tax=Aquimarina hainanensis TaxID=1578017 RepID=A0ABW5N7D7_9FLAO|nr:M12 family metallopeptidase [Aquimarina sp. TRL1]QKX05601.1 hypothetical protein HN014_11965 [Aquimarina sp. TRL1]